MSLRTQLLLAGLMMLALPLATWVYVRELYDVLRDAGLREMSARVEMIGSLIEQRPESTLLANPPSTSLFYAETAEQSLILDGFAEDWENFDQAAAHFAAADGSDALSVRMAVSGGRLFVYAAVRDDAVVLHEPSLGRVISGDRLVLNLQSDEADVQYIFRTIAPGRLTALRVVDQTSDDWRVIADNAIQAFWQMTSTGYAIELRLSLPAQHTGLAFQVADVDQRQTQAAVYPSPAAKGSLIYPSATLSDEIASLVPPAHRLRIFNNAGWMISDINRLSGSARHADVIDPRTADLPTALLYRLLAVMTEGRQSDGSAVAPDSTERWSVGNMPQSTARSGRYRQQGQLMLAIQQPMPIGGVMVLEAADESVSAVVSSTLVRLFAVLMAIVLSLLVVLMLYAGWITRRIGAIGTATRDALKLDGRIETRIPDGARRDELGELSRNITTLLSRLRAYTDYLQSLSARLTHELRTPLAVVATSLESCQRGDRADAIYLQRAAEATRRLQSIIRAMTESTRLEEMVRHAEFEEIDMTDWLQAVVPVYQDLYPQRAFQLTVGPTASRIKACTDLLQQLLDKLIANAVDFSPVDSVVHLSLVSERGRVVLLVSNEGPLLPAAIADRVFDPMVSQREPGTAGETPHLGLGLYIVSLVASAHGGTVKAKNKNDGGGVEVAVSLPQSDAR